MTRLRALWRSPIDRHAAKVAALAAVAGAVIFFAATLPGALNSSGRVTTATDARLLDLVHEELLHPGTIAAQTAARLGRGQPLLWFVPDRGAPRPARDPLTPTLPAELASVVDPRAAVIDGIAFRVAGVQVDGGQFVAAVADTGDPSGEDEQLLAALDAASRSYEAAPAAVRLAPPRPPGPRLLAELAWKVAPDGTATPMTGSATPVLPDELRDAEAPVTAAFGGMAYRVAGAVAADGHLVVAVPDELTQSSAIQGNLPFVPAVAAAVFVVAFAIGRWAATPIEDARRRQLALTADASHELRTPLAVIEAETSLALGRERDAPAYREALERVAVESGRLRRLVEDMLWLARFDAKPPGPEAAEVDAREAARAAVARFQPVAATRGQVLRADVAGDPPARITAPAEWLDKLLGVLLDNACRYSPDGAPIAVLVEVAGGQVRLAVEDAGPGIPPEERARVFDRFHRASERPGGTGLGLAIADAVVRATRGRWEIGSSPFGGASMAVSWPRAAS
ncbi:MAG TPA: HAMP domain-containing sensor histidine kinase [Terriglobales bacterium]|nr:HAMP domain-containing sensor histidine kinase [Terriglobales bacterium]